MGGDGTDPLSKPRPAGIPGPPAPILPRMERIHRDLRVAGQAGHAL